MERGEAAAEFKEQQFDCVGAAPSAGDRLLQQRPEPSQPVHGHQRALPGAHPGCAEAGRVRSALKRSSRHARGSPVL